jgi:hypothetical protein
MNEIEMGVRIPVDNYDDLISTLDELIKEDIIVEYQVKGENTGFPEFEIEFSDYSVLAHHEMRPRYPNDMEEQKGLHITRSFKYNREYDPGEFESIGDQFELLDDIRGELEEATSVDATSYIDRVVS